MRHKFEIFFVFFIKQAHTHTQTYNTNRYLHTITSLSTPWKSGLACRVAANVRQPQSVEINAKINNSKNILSYSLLHTLNTACFVFDSYLCRGSYLLLLDSELCRPQTASYNQMKPNKNKKPNHNTSVNLL